MSSQLWPVHLEYLVNLILATEPRRHREEENERGIGKAAPPPPLSPSPWLCGSVAKPMSQSCALWFSVRGRAYSTAKREEFLEMKFILRRGGIAGRGLTVSLIIRVSSISHPRSA